MIIEQRSASNTVLTMKNTEQSAICQLVDFDTTVKLAIPQDLPPSLTSTSTSSRIAMQLELLKSLAILLVLGQKTVTGQDSTTGDQNLTVGELNSTVSKQNLAINEPKLALIETGDHNLTFDESNSTVRKQNLAISEPKLSVSEQNLAIGDQNFTVRDQNLTIDKSKLSVSDQNLAISDQNFTVGEPKLSVIKQNLTVTSPYVCNDLTKDTIASVDCQFVLRKFTTDGDKTHPKIVDPASSRHMDCGSCNLTLTDNSPNGTLRISLEAANDALESLAVNCSGHPGTYAMVFSSDRSTAETTLTIAYGGDDVCTTE